MGGSEVGNVGFICTDCNETRKRTAQSQLGSMPLQSLVGKFVKAPFVFTIGGKEVVEHMWVEVKRIEEEIVGTLANDSVCDPTYHEGIPIVIDRNQVEDILD